MIDKDLMPRAYKECLEILKYIPEEDVKKIPMYIIENMKEEMDSEYQYSINHLNDFENQEMLEETKTILAVLFRDYWATEEQRTKIKAKEVYDLQLLEEAKKEKYNYCDLFKNKSENINLEQDYSNNNKQLIEYKENFFIKLKNIILKLFHIK